MVRLPRDPRQKGVLGRGVAWHGECSGAAKKGSVVGSISSGCTLRDIYIRGWSRLTNHAEVRAALEVLADYGFSRVDNH